MRVKDGVAVAGSHGKTTTTTDDRRRSWREAGAGSRRRSSAARRAPSGRTRASGSGELLVAEADESDGSFRHLFPTVAVVTNIDREHLDHFGSAGGAVRRVSRLCRQGAVLWIGRDRRRQPRGGAPGRRSSEAPRHLRPAWRATGAARSSTPAPSGTRFRVRVRGQRPRRGARPHAGRPLRRATRWRRCAWPTSWASRSRPPARRWRRSRASTGASRCAARRRGVLVVDDYGHHPTELAATVAAARLLRPAAGGGVPAPPLHAHARLLHEFAPALAGADELLLTDIYAAGEAPIAGVDDGGAARDVSRRHRAVTSRATALAGGAGRGGAPGRSGALPGRGRHHRRADGAAAPAGARRRCA